MVFFFFFFFELNLFNVKQILVYIDGADTWEYYTKLGGDDKGHIKSDKYVREGGRSTGWSPRLRLTQGGSGRGGGGQRKAWDACIYLHSVAPPRAEVKIASREVKGRWASRASSWS